MHSFSFVDSNNIGEHSNSVSRRSEEEEEEEEEEENSLSLPLQMRVHILSGQELDRIIRERSIQYDYFQIYINPYNQTHTFST